MAMLTDQFPGSEIALGIQLKHIASRALANRSTQGYANADKSWAAHLESAIEAARFRRLEDLYRPTRPANPSDTVQALTGSAKPSTTFSTAVQARGGDETVERSLLRKARISIRFGALNHCVLDEKNPAGAAASNKPSFPKATWTIADRCRPDRCADSVIGPEHIPIWASKQRALLTLIDTPGLPTCRTQALQRELHSVETILAKTHTARTRHERRLRHLRRCSARPRSAPRAAKRLRDAMNRLLSGCPQRTDGRLIKDNLWKEAGLSRATMNRAVHVLAEWNIPVAECDGFTPGRPARTTRWPRCRRKLADKTRDCTELHHRLDAAATAIAALHHDNVLLRQALNERGAIAHLALRALTEGRKDQLGCESPKPASAERKGSRLLVVTSGRHHQKSCWRCYTANCLHTPDSGKVLPQAV